MLMCSRLFPLSLRSGLNVSGFMLMSLIRLDLSFMQGDRYVSICSLLHADIQLAQHHLKLSFFIFFIV